MLTQAEANRIHSLGRTAVWRNANPENQRRYEEFLRRNRDRRRKKMEQEKLLPD